MKQPRHGAIRLLIGCLAVAIPFLALAQAAPGPQVTGLRIGPIEVTKIGVALLVAPAAVGKCAGQFRGELGFLDAAPGVQIAGTFAAGAQACELRASIPWSLLPEEAVQGIRNDGLRVRVRGERTDGRNKTKVAWAAHVPRAAIQFAEPMKVTLPRFAQARDIRIGALGLEASTVDVEIAVRSPLRFHLRVLQVRCELQMEGLVVATGHKNDFLIFGGRPNTIAFPVRVNNGAMLNAMGSGIARGAQAEGKLVGVARLRLSGGDIDVPVEFPVNISLR
ncbi:MAG: hypothetical protein NDI88_02600 [Lysobacter sp.]|nr:hypothetical protein [Lysobacter sp.]